MNPLMNYESSVLLRFEVTQKLENSMLVMILYPMNRSMLKDEVSPYKQLLINAKCKAH